MRAKYNMMFSHASIEQAALKSGIANADDFDFALLVMLIGAANVELQNIDLLNEELMRIVRQQEANKKSYHKKKDSENTERRNTISIIPFI